MDRLGSRPQTSAAPSAAETTQRPPQPAVPDSGAKGAAAHQVLARYTSWWEARITAFANTSKSGVGIGLFSTGQALSDSLANVYRLREAGMVMQGRPRSDARVVALDLDATPQTATVEDCLDVREWHQADARTKQIRDPKQRLSRYMVTATARHTDQGWLITELKPETERTC
ncbi:hypothetical protein [Peterkaempfera bronchialis]|uniref:Uncharacterized protein n=1 Tax=Peterkaempfera bronchialis TaxID=2126346 RepID=A0A345ST03_9ACTN|nr:hypothetical protein [Peterkaempfera bronchialis]AXI76858.1 hypothetical protein C7M71_004695 [Peterkaempfera bronchialis]